MNHSSLESESVWKTVKKINNVKWALTHEKCIIDMRLSFNACNLSCLLAKSITVYENVKSANTIDNECQQNNTKNNNAFFFYSFIISFDVLLRTWISIRRWSVFLLNERDNSGCWRLKGETNKRKKKKWIYQILISRMSSLPQQMMNRPPFSKVEF